MTAEIICIGTELLLGNTLNSNAHYLARELAALGIPHYYQTVVGDNPTRIHQVIETAIARSQLLIFTGGLGPTPDDLTTEAIAAFFQTPLIERPEIIEDITQKFAQRGRTMSPSNRKQALLPQGADILTNPVGSAPGMIWQPRPNLTILTFPGVPSELYRMWQDIAVPYLQQQGWASSTIYSQMMRFWGIAESTLAERVSQWFDSTNPTVAPYADLGEVKLRVCAKANSKTEAQALIAPVVEELKQIAGRHYYGSDDETLARVVGRLLLNAGGTLSVAESCTGGKLGQMLTDVPGSSEYFWGGAIAYDNRVKISLLDVNPADLDDHGAVSHPIAQQMASGICQRLGTTWGLSITGIAGPGGGTVDKPIGLVYIGLARSDGWVESWEYRCGATHDRAWIRHVSSCHALDRLRLQLLDRHLN
jgi:nicotinamide-nucleotide amidase